jgi:hypothetical protein
MEVSARSGDPFYVTTVQFGVTGSSLEAWILLPLRTLAYGRVLVDHTFSRFSPWLQLQLDEQHVAGSSTEEQESLYFAFTSRSKEY